MRSLDILLPVIGSALLLALSVIMVRRRLQREYPFFFAYVVFVLLSSVAVFSLSGHAKIFFRLYWATEPVNAVLALLALHEAFRDVFYGFFSFWWFRLIFPSAVALISFFSIRHAILNPPAQATRVAAIILSVGTAVNWVQAGLFAIFMLLVVVLHVRWRRYPYDMALGFAVATIGDWIAFALRSEFGTKYANVTRYAPPVAYILATLIWLRSFSGRFEPEPRLQWRQDISPQQLLAEVKEYIRIMRKVLGKRNGF